MPVVTPDPTTQYQAPKLPNYDLNGAPAQDINNANFLLNPTFDASETKRNAAQAAVGGGFQGGSFAQGQGVKLLDSERIARMKLGHDILDPYLNRESNQAISESANQAAWNRTVQEGAQAMQRLQLSEAGLGARLTQEEHARLTELAQQGQQAMQLASLNNAAELGRTNAQIGGNLANTYIQGLLNQGRNVGTSSGGSGSWVDTVDASGNPVSSTNPFGDLRPSTSTSGGGVNNLSQINSILSRYGVPAV